MRSGRITALESVPKDGTFLFRVEPVEETEVREAILVRSADGVTGWLNYCQHFTHVRLDKGAGATTRNGEIVCTNHGAMFEVDTGLCTYGPCLGAYLNELDIRVEGGDVFLDDPDYALVGRGPIPRDSVDRSSRSNVEF